MRSNYDQATVNATHAAHRQEHVKDTAPGVLPFFACSCGQMFESEDAAVAHWWRALQARAVRTAHARSESGAA